ncbi:hypothetical protein GI364_15055 [Alicyclobacillus sp. SO9]|nr:hypothetical protein GI364_15055 [Alicyclobacillus sp. SO9]
MCILTAQDGTITTIMVECKYTSPKSNSLDRHSWSHGDQLAEQYYDLVTNRLNVSDANYKKISSSERKYLFYVTAHYALPRADIQESAELLRNKGVNESYNCLFWTSWRKVSSIIEPQIADSETDTMTVRLLTDLRLLLHRKRLVPFQGFKAVDSFDADGLNRPFFWRQAGAEF